MEMPELHQEWRELSSLCQSRYVRGAGQAAAMLGETGLPAEHSWIYDTAESLEHRMQRADGQEALDELLRSLERDFVAYAIMHAWKVQELVAGAIVLLNRGLVVAAAAPARSAVESAIALNALSFRWYYGWQQLPTAEDPSSIIEDLDARLRAHIWGRKSDLKAIDAFNILTLKDYFLKTSTDPDSARELPTVYEQLCDVVHPSATGHQTSWHQPVDDTGSGQRLVPLRRDQPSVVTAAVAELVLWAIGWSSSWTQQAVRYATEHVAPSARGGGEV